MKPTVNCTRKPVAPAYAGDVLFFVDRRAKKIITAQAVHKGKGWVHTRVGNCETTARENKVREVLEAKYPSYDGVSLFSEFSYHSGLASKGKITKYGTKDYTLQFSDYKPIGKFTLVNPVKTENKKEFGKVKKSVTLQKWHYIVLNWIPSGNSIKLQVEEKEKNPLDDDREIFKSRVFSMEEKKQAIQLFKSRVEAFKKTK